MFGGRDVEEVYLPAKPCRDILSWARIKVAPHWPIEEHHYNSPDGEYIEFVIPATITDGSGREIDVIGNRSTRDEFFGIAGKDRKCKICGTAATYGLPWPSAQYKSWFCKDHPNERPEEVIHYLPLHDVDIASVRQAAVTNLLNDTLQAVALVQRCANLQQREWMFPR